MRRLLTTVIVSVLVANACGGSQSGQEAPSQATATTAPTTSTSSDPTTTSSSIPTTTTTVQTPAPALAPESIPSAIAVEEVTEYYDVSGYTTSGLRADLENKKPVAADGARYDAFTTYIVTWEFLLDWSAQSCRVNPTRLVVTIHQTLPRRVGESGPQTIARWDTYIAALELHEDGHGNLGINAAIAIFHSLAAVPPQATCEGAESLANSNAQALLAEYDQHALDYDAATAHGLATGAMFP